MAQSFNLNNFLQEYKTYNNRQYTAAENGKAAMEKRDIEHAEEALKQASLLSLTLGEKMAQLGIGEHVVKQIGETAANVVKNVVSPLTEYLDKYEKVFDENMYIQEIQGYAKQMFFARNELAKDSTERVPTGQKFVYDM